VRGQGLWALVALVATEAPSVTLARVVTGSSVPLPTATVRGALLAAWADLVVAVVQRTEV
jgi:hypothetical protein